MISEAEFAVSAPSFHQHKNRCNTYEFELGSTWPELSGATRFVSVRS